MRCLLHVLAVACILIGVALYVDQQNLYRNHLCASDMLSVCLLAEHSQDRSHSDTMWSLTMLLVKKEMRIMCLEVADMMVLKRRWQRKPVKCQHRQLQVAEAALTGRRTVLCWDDAPLWWSCHLNHPL